MTTSTGEHGQQAGAGAGPVDPFRKKPYFKRPSSREPMMMVLMSILLVVGMRIVFLSSRELLLTRAGLSLAALAGFFLVLAALLVASPLLVSLHERGLRVVRPWATRTVPWGEIVRIGPARHGFRVVDRQGNSWTLQQRDYKHLEALCHALLDLAPEAMAEGGYLPLLWARRGPLDAAPRQEPRRAWRVSRALWVCSLLLIAMIGVAWLRSPAMALTFLVVDGLMLLRGAARLLPAVLNDLDERGLVVRSLFRRARRVRWSEMKAAGICFAEPAEDALLIVDQHGKHYRLALGLYTDPWAPVCWVIQHRPDLFDLEMRESERAGLLHP